MVFKQIQGCIPDQVKPLQFRQEWIGSAEVGNPQPSGSLARLLKPKLGDVHTLQSNEIP